MVLVLAGLQAAAQATPEGRPRAFCGFDEQQELYFAQHPGARLLYHALNQRLAALPQQRPTGLPAPTITIPVVVHVVHGGGADNISDRQINSALELLNIDYQRRNSDTTTILPAFLPISANLGVQFKLAKRDPNGNCTTGITRTFAPALVNDDRAGTVKDLIRWDTERYLNIWLVSTIGTPATGGSFVLGYAQFPGQNAATDGLVIRHDYFGDQGTSNLARAASRTATHEVGHYLGLLHPWGSGAVEMPGNCSGNDFVADTPPTNGTYACTLSYAPCGPVANVQNFMDYAACANMFTLGQRDRMLGVLQTTRTALTTPANLLATGTNDGYVVSACAPIAAFAPAAGSRTSVCVNTPVALRDYSSNFTAAGGTLSYTWSFPGGTPATATGQTVTVRYANAGFYPVTETVTNSVGSGTSTVSNFIRVEGPTGGETAPFAQSFEDAGFPNLYPAPTLRNYELSGETSAGVPSASFRWQRQTSVAAADGSAYLVVNNRVIAAGGVTTLTTPNINLSSLAGTAVLRFDRALALRTAASNEQLQVSFSDNCGLSWSTPAVLDVTALSTQGLTPINGYAPTSSADWQTLTVPIPAQFQGSGLFKVRLQLVNGTTQGNIFYFDHLRVTGPLATKADALASRGISLYPNPLTAQTAVHLHLPAATQVQVRLTDLLGREVRTLPTKTYGAGAQTLPLTTAGHPLRAGVYVVRIALNGETFSTRLTVE